MVKRPGPADVERVPAEVLRAPIVTADAEHFGANAIEAARGFGVAALDAIRAGVARRQPMEDQGFVTAAVGRGHAEFAETFRSRRHEIDGGGAEFLADFEDDLAGRIDPLIEDVRAGGYRPSAGAIAEARGRLASLGVRMSGRAAEIEHAARFAKQVTGLDGVLASLRDRAFAEPDLFHAILDDATEVAEGARAFLPDAEVARRLADVRGRIPRAALKGMIAQTPSLAREGLEGGAFDDVVEGAAKAALVRDARTAEARDKALEKARAAEERAAFAADLTARVRRGHAGHADIAEAVEAKALTAQDAKTLRDAADRQAELTARVAALIAGEDAELLDPQDADHSVAVENFYGDAIAPAIADLPEEAATARLIRFVQRIGVMPTTLVNELRAGILSGVPKDEVKASGRIVTLDDLGPDVVPLPIAEQARAHAIAGFAATGLKPERAVELGTKLMDEKGRVPAVPRGGDADETGVTDFLYRPRMIVDSDGTLRPETREEETRRTAEPMVLRPGFVWDIGTWRRETPEEAERSKPQPLGLANGQTTAPAVDHSDSNSGDNDHTGEIPPRSPDDRRTGKNGTNEPAKSSWPTNDGQDATFNDYRARLAKREGGFVDDKRDPGGPTQKGISQEALDEINKQHPEWGLPEKSRDLSDEQIDGLFRQEYYDRPKIDDVASIPGLPEASPQLPEQLFDSGVLHGPETAGRLLQESLDEVMGTDLKEERKDGTKAYDGNVGPRTRAAIARAVEEGKASAVNDTMVTKRLEYMRGLSNFKTFGRNWESRARSFLSSSSD